MWPSGDFWNDSTHNNKSVGQRKRYLVIHESKHESKKFVHTIQRGLFWWSGLSCNSWLKSLAPNSSSLLYSSRRRLADLGTLYSGNNDQKVKLTASTPLGEAKTCQRNYLKRQGPFQSNFKMMLIVLQQIHSFYIHPFLQWLCSERARHVLAK